MSRKLVAILAFLGGSAIAGCLGTFAGNQFHDHDTGLLVTVFVSMVAGFPVGLASVAVWLRDNSSW